MKKQLLLIAIIIYASDLFSQSVSPYVVSPSGNFYSNSTASLSWTLGEPVIATVNNNKNMLTQGFQQGSYTFTAVTENSNNLKLYIYPNPTTSIININYVSKSHEALIAVIYNIEGKKIFEKQINDNDNTIDLACFESSMYLLNISDEKGIIIKTYKIQKIDR